MNRRAFVGTMCACAASLEAASNVPRPAGPLEIMMPDGTKTNVTKYAGKVVCVAFILTTCPHCQETSALLSRLNSEYGSKGFQPLAAAFNDGAMMQIPEFVRRFNVNFPVGVIAREPMLSFMHYSAMSRLMVPQVAFIDRKGVVRAQSTEQNEEVIHSEANLRKNIELLLKEAAGGAAKPTSKAPAKSATVAARK